MAVKLPEGDAGGGGEGGQVQQLLLELGRSCGPGILHPWGGGVGFRGVAEHVNGLRGRSHVASGAVRLVSVELISLHFSLQDLFHFETSTCIIDGLKAVETLQALVGRIVRDTGVGVKVVGMVVPDSCRWF